MITDSIENIRNDSLNLLDSIRIPAYSILSEKPDVMDQLRVLKEHLKNAISEKNELSKIVPVFLMRQWILASIYKSIRRIRAIEKKAPGKRMPSRREIEIAALWAYQAISIFKSRALFQDMLDQGDRYILDQSAIKKGDIILSYKTAKYLKRDILARLVSIATNSAITHSLVATEDGENSKLLCSSPEGNGINLLPPHPNPGEIYIIMRPRDIGARYEQHIRHAINTWRDRVNTATGTPYRYKFAEMKSWIASAVGFIYVLSTYLSRRSITLPNFAKDQQGIFCSEMIDDIFKEIGILVGPRSEHDAVIGPVEIFHSPYLAMQGVIVNEADHESMRKELAQKFNLV